MTHQGAQEPSAGEVGSWGLLLQQRHLSVQKPAAGVEKVGGWSHVPKGPRSLQPGGGHPGVSGSACKAAKLSLEWMQGPE